VNILYHQYFIKQKLFVKQIELFLLHFIEKAT